jgi:hypothetical protein
MRLNLTVAVDDLWAQYSCRVPVRTDPEVFGHNMATRRPIARSGLYENRQRSLQPPHRTLFIYRCGIVEAMRKLYQSVVKSPEPARPLTGPCPDEDWENKGGKRLFQSREIVRQAETRLSIPGARQWDSFKASRTSAV